MVYLSITILLVAKLDLFSLPYRCCKIVSDTLHGSSLLDVWQDAVENTRASVANKQAANTRAGELHRI